jgi:hypothetical protein
MKKNVIVKTINVLLKSARWQRSQNNLTAEQSAEIDRHISELEALLKEVEATPEELDDIAGRLTVLSDEIKALAEKRNAGEPTPVENYLKGDEALKDMFRIIRNCARTGASFSGAWEGHLRSKNYIGDGAEIVPGVPFIPAAIEQRIIDRWNEDNNWLKDLRRSNAKVFVPIVNAVSQDAAEAGANEHTPTKYAEGGNPEFTRTEKIEQVLRLIPEMVTVGAVYKLQRIDKIVQYMDDGTLMDYIVDEMYKQCLKYIADCILGIKTSTHILPALTMSPNGTITADNNLSLIENLRAMVSAIGRDSDIYLFMTKATFNQLARRVHAAGGSVFYVPREVVADELGVARIITRETMPDDGNGNTATAVAFCPDDYLLFGQATNVSLDTQKDLKYNLDCLLAEVFVGGCPTALDSAAMLIGWDGSLGVKVENLTLTDVGGGKVKVGADLSVTGTPVGGPHYAVIAVNASDPTDVTTVLGSGSSLDETLTLTSGETYNVTVIGGVDAQAAADVFACSVTDSDTKQIALA